MAAILRRVVWNLEDGHVRAAARLVVHEASERWHEWRLGIDTSQYVPTEGLGFASPDANHYIATDYRGFRKVMDRMEIDPGRDVFVDFGSGMGRAVVMAATYPFRRVIGVEASAALNELARANIERARRHMRCPDVRIEQIDAAEYAVPDDVTYVYCYNSFRGASLSRVLSRLRSSLAAAPRHLTLIFKNPVCLDTVAAEDLAWLTKRGDSPSRYGGNYAIYEGRS